MVGGRAADATLGPRHLGWDRATALAGKAHPTTENVMPTNTRQDGDHDVPADGSHAATAPADTSDTPDTAAASALGLPSGVRVLLFDLDGVLTRTAAVHARAWQTMFDAFLDQRRRAGGLRPEDATPFTPEDYQRYVDGRPRADGVRAFLASRSISLPEGAPGDDPGAPTVHGLGNQKNELLLRLLREDGVEVFDDAVVYLRRARAAGLRTAVVSSSANTTEVLRATGLTDAFDAVVDGLVARRDGLRGKPAPDTFLAAARALDVDPDGAAVFEDALAGVEAGRAGGFALVVGVDRVGHAAALREHGADVVVQDLAELTEGSR